MTDKPIAQMAVKYHIAAYPYGLFSGPTPGNLGTCLGYGDAIMSSSLKRFRTFEGVDEMLIFGVSAAIIISAIQLMLRTRFHELRNFQA